MSTDNILMIGLGVVLFVGLVLFAYISQAGRNKGHLDKKFYQREWARIEQLQKQGGAGWHMAVMEADKLLDQALRAQGYPGDTMGERLKDARRTFRNNDGIWQAHKLRNRLAHESGNQLNSFGVSSALKQFKNGLKDLGAL